MSTVPQVSGVGKAVEAQALPHVEPSGTAARAGLQLLAAGVISLVANYLFLLAAGRLLGSADYGTLAALTGLLTFVLLPAGALQMAVSREVSRREAVGEAEDAAAFVRALMFLGIRVTFPLAILSLALLVPLREVLRIDASMPVAIALLGLVSVFVYPIAAGALQGQQRFAALAVLSAAPMVIRLVLFGVFVIAGSRLFGALGAVAAASFLAATLGLMAVRSQLRVAVRCAAPDLHPFLRYLVPVAVGLFGIAALTNIDIVVAKARFDASDAGVFGAALAFARVAFFLPGTILAVLFPRTAARQARGEGSSDILGRSVIVTVAFCGVLAAAYSVIGAELVRVTYGPDFAAATALLVPACVAMTLFSVANVLVGYHLSRGESRFAWIVAAAVPVHLLLLTTIPSSLLGLLWADVAVAATLLAVHELVMGSSAAAIAAGYRRLRVGETLKGWVSAVVGARRGIREGVLAVAGYALVAVAATWPLSVGLGSRIPGIFPNDGAGGAGWFWRLHQEGGYRLLGVTHHTLTGAPLGWDQGNMLNFQWLLPDYPGYLVAGLFGGVVALNVVTLSGLALSGGAMYWLTRWLGCGRLVSAWAGFVFVIFPWHLQRALAGHVTLVHLEVFPLVLLAALAWLQRPDGKRAFLVTLAVLLAWLTSGYFGVMTLALVAAVAVVALRTVSRERGFVQTLRATLPLWLMPLCATALFAAVSILIGSSEGVRLSRGVEDLDTFGAHLENYLPDPLNPVAGGLIGRGGRASAALGAEASLYPGIVTVLLAAGLVAAAVARRTRSSRRGAVPALVAVCFAGVIFASPSPLRVAGLEIASTPSRVLFDILPAFRVPSRFAAVIMVGLIPLAALSLQLLVDAVSRRVGARSGGRVALLVSIAAVSAVSIAELAPMPFVVADVGRPPAAYAAVAHSRGIVAEYPLLRSDRLETSEYLLWQAFHRRPLLNGSSLGSAAEDVRRTLVDPAAPGVSSSLALLGVASIITRPTTYQWHPTVRATATEPRDYGVGYELEAGRLGAPRVWTVTAEPAPALAVYRSGAVAEAVPGESAGRPRFPVSERTVEIDLYAKRPGVWLLSFEVIGEESAAALTVEGVGRRLVVDAGRDSFVRVPVDVPRGRSSVKLTLGTGALRGKRTLAWLGVPSVGVAADANDAPLRPFLHSVDPGF
jgi:O-antigen/teichoic acid export membrane protein